MRGAYRGNDNTLRWALVGGIVVVVVIATVIAIASNLGGKKAAPPKKNSNGSGPSATCLYPKSVKLQSALMTAPVIKAKALNPLYKMQLATAEKVLARKAKSVVAVTASGSHYLSLNAKGHLILGTPGTKSHKLKVAYEDIGFNAPGKRLIYQKDPKYTPYKSCATLVLVSRRLGHKRHHVLFAGQFTLANDASGTGPLVATQGILQGDELSTGWIVLISHGRLYAYNPNRHVVGPIETPALGQLFAAAGGVTESALVKFSVSPNLRFAISEADASSLLQVHNLPSWSVLPYSLSGAIADVSWSHSGNRVAYIKTKPSVTGLPKYIVMTINLVTGKRHAIKYDRKKLGNLTLGNLRWSRDDKWVAFTGTPTTGKPLAFLGSWTGKHVHVLNKADIASTGTAGTTSASDHVGMPDY